MDEEPTEGHAGDHAVSALLRHGVDVMYTLNGGHIWPFYEAARAQGMRIVDTRDERTATFAAEAHAKLTRNAGLAVLTAGPGVTNCVSALTTARFNGSPLVVFGGRAPQRRWGAGSLQELDHVPIVSSLTKSAATVFDAAKAGSQVEEAIRTATTPHRGPVFLDFPLDLFRDRHPEPVPSDEGAATGSDDDVDEAAVRAVAKLVADARRPAMIVGSDVYWDGAWDALRAAAERLRIPCFANGLGRGCLPGDHELSFSRTRGLLKSEADLVVVIGTPLDFRLGFGRYGDANVVHVVDAPEGEATYNPPSKTLVGSLRGILGRLADAPTATTHEDWLGSLRAREEAARAEDDASLTADTDPIRPTRLYGEVIHRLARDAVVICDGGDFVSYAGKYIDSYEPGCWLDTGPFGCLGNGIGYAIAARVARPDAQVVAMLGDGALGFSLIDVDSLVRHNLPVVMVVGNNGMWGLEKHPMHSFYGWDVACDLQPATRYDEVVTALGGAGETVTRPDAIGPALDRAFASGVPYLVNVMIDPDDEYPRTSKLG